MIFIETPVFTKQVLQLLSDERHRQLQRHLAAYPDAGAMIQGTGGLRKLRWAPEGQGKRGGVRVIYYWRQSMDQILMLLLYGKSEKDDLTPAEKKALARTIEQW